MGQYYRIVNVDKGELIDPNQFVGDGQKLVEFAFGSGGVLTALAALLADGNGEGLGDLKADAEVVGSWAGDRIVVAGDYAEEGKFLDGYDDIYAVDMSRKPLPLSKLNLYRYAIERFKDISKDIAEALAGEISYTSDGVVSGGVEHRPPYVPEESDWLKDRGQKAADWPGGVLPGKSGP